MKIKFFIFASFILIIISKSFAGSCADGSDPLKSISADGTYYVYSCEEQAPSSQVSSSINTIEPRVNGWDIRRVGNNTIR